MHFSHGPLSKKTNYNQNQNKLIHILTSHSWGIIYCACFYLVIPALLHQMEKFQLSVGLNNGWLCSTVAEIPVNPHTKKAKCCKEFPLQTD